MSKEKQIKPFTEAHREFGDSLTAFKQAAVNLSVAVDTVISLIGSGIEPQQAIEQLKTPNKEFKKAWIG